ncbi:hypothetical protein CLAIMM_11739 [Cladophialophora immunda]|nr:hypothetical protein CLAIMM_11739 [Cladophialophora immunda]
MDSAESSSKSLLLTYRDSLSDGVDEALYHTEKRPVHRKCPFPSLYTAIVHLAILILVPAVIVLHRRAGKGQIHDPMLQLYSPVNDHIEHEIKLIKGGFAFSNDPDAKAYVGSSNATNELWLDLYQYSGPSIVSAEENALLPQKTSNIKGHPDKHVMILEVFHELHCLDRIRQSLYPETFGWVTYPDGTKDTKKMGHLEHCVDLLRQTIMCVGDTSVGIFQRQEDGSLKADSDVLRVCRSFEKIHEWAAGRHAQVAVA